MPTYEVTLKPEGNTIRVTLPEGASDADISGAARLEYTRRFKPAAEAVKPLSEKEYPGVEGRAPRQFTERAFRDIPGAFGRWLKPSHMLEVAKSFPNPFEGLRPVTPESLKAGESGEDIPVVGSLLRAIRGEMPPEEAADLIPPLIGGGVGRELAPRPGFATRVGRGFKAAAQPYPVSPLTRAVGAAVGGAIGGGAASELGLSYPMPWIATGAGATIGAALPGSIRAFRESWGRPVTTGPAYTPLFTVDPYYRRAGGGGWTRDYSQTGPGGMYRPPGVPPDVAYPAPPRTIEASPVTPPLQLGPGYEPPEPAQLPPGQYDIPPSFSEKMAMGRRAKASERAATAAKEIERLQNLPKPISKTPQTPPPEWTISSETAAPQPIQPTESIREVPPSPPEKPTTPPPPAKVVRLSDIKKFAKIHDPPLSVEEMTQQFRDSGYEIRRPKIRRRT